MKSLLYAYDNAALQWNSVCADSLELWFPKHRGSIEHENH